MYKAYVDGRIVEVNASPELTVRNVFDFLDQEEKITDETIKKLAKEFRISETFARSAIKKYNETRLK